MKHIYALKGTLLKAIWLIVVFGAFTSALYGEVVSKPCPFSCSTEGLAKAGCADWKEGDTCFVKHSSLKAATDANLERDIILLNQDLDRGAERQVDLKEMPVAGVDIVLSRRGNDTSTKLDLRMDGATSFGAAQQIDRNEPHVVRFMTVGQRSQGKKLVLRALDGRVNVESVHILYEKEDATDE